MRDGDVLGPAFERRIFGGVEPLEDVFAGLDPLDDGEPEAFELPLLVPIGGEDPGADPQGLSRDRAVGLAGAAGLAPEGPGEMAPAAPMFVVCSDAGFVVVSAISGLDGSGPPVPLRTCSSIRR
jgi:hypothetical protein